MYERQIYVVIPWNGWPIFDGASGRRSNPFERQGQIEKHVAFIEKLFLSGTEMPGVSVNDLRGKSFNCL